MKYLLQNNNYIDVICLNETRLDNSITDNAISINGYDVFRKDRDREGGGVAIYVNRNGSFTYKVRNDLMPTDLEMIILEITQPKCKPFLIISWYRPPGTHMDLFEKINHVLENVECTDKEVMIVGDTNCDLLTSNPTCYTLKMKEIAINFHLKQLIKKPTRITENSKTLIDHIYVPAEKICKSGVLYTGISDHGMVYVTIGKDKKQIKNKHKFKTNRSYKHFDDNAFVHDMENVNWEDIVHHDNIDDVLEDFENKFLKITNQHAPLKKKRVRQKQSPWLTVELINEMRKRDYLKKKACKSNSTEIWTEFKNKKNKVNIMIKKCKQNYFSEQLNTKNTKKIWENLRNIVPSKSKNTDINNIKTEEGIKSNPYDIANALNEYFSTIGPKLAESIPKGNDNDIMTSDQSIINKFNFSQIDEEYIYNQLHKLSSNKATGNDEIPCKLIKLAINSILAPITYIVNLSLTTGCFPQKWKNARICPVFKGGDNTEPCNYRPISILPILSKILERTVFDQLYPYLNSHSLIYEKQSGFRPNFSTSSALINVTEDWINAIDKGEYVGLIMLDLKKAFDTVNHDILIKKLNNFSISPCVIAWFKNYLTGRIHNTNVNGTSSRQCRSICGIPQGSILGPLLFLLYVNDLPNVVNHVTVSMYADDTALYYVSKDVNEVTNKINIDLENVRKWLSSNKLSLNVDKTELMFIGTHQKLSRLSNLNLNININGTRLQRVSQCKHLGVKIDETLSWNMHIEHIKTKVLPGLYYLKKSSCLIPMHLQSMLYKTIVAPHFDYCNVVWGRCNKTLSNKLQVLQNRAAKIITKKRKYDSGTQALEELKWSNLEYKLTFNEQVMMYKIMNDLTPNYLKKKFSQRHSVYNTRSINNLYIDKPNTEYKKRSLTYRGAHLWNNLNQTTKNAPTLNHFKKIISN